MRLGKTLLRKCIKLKPNLELRREHPPPNSDAKKDAKDGDDVQDVDFEEVKD